MEKEFKFILMDQGIKDNFKMVLKMITMQLINGQMERFIKALLKMDIWKVMVA